MTPIEKLQAGNHRFLNDQVHLHSETREKYIQTQTPFCALLACADSRVAPEILFDQSLGDLFVVRVAGNIASPTVIESLTFAVDILKVPQLVVMGHQNCGAVQAVREGTSKSLPHITNHISKAFEKTHSLKEAVIANVHHQISELKKHFSIPIQGAYYDFETGEVAFI